ncbi:tRNA (adenosine(37)-N6)-threonylcarbamoyltransferase complex ATPase subunit type 1 TsaE [Catelliglobosispora koreensis]|uniref:tRNA (adenosine(37)-N6)-threonylcarbamoyltransferase complex ATPase subunit type 1 TsaE n=1 Tax=Catelliglobosispora koreensis TaxID=129052 RepID=UPI000685B67F
MCRRGQRSYKDVFGAVVITLATPAETRAFGVRLAAVLRPGDLIILNGPLGAGKTALTQGIGIGLGVSGDVTSPTFVISRVHRGPLPLVHVDAYRLRTVELDDLDLDASLEDSVTVVEWGHGVVERLSDSFLEIIIDREPDDTRVVTLNAHGGTWPDRLKDLAH